MATPPGFTIDMLRCTRCGGDHKGVVFKALNKPMRVEGASQRDYDEFTHWAMCPTLNEPLIAKMLGVTTR